VLILFTTVAPHPFTNKLLLSGHQAHEAVEVSEVFSLMEQDPSVTIIIIVTADTDANRANVVQRHYPTLRLKASTTVQDILWEICH
jgi:hypothetical protein